jgi:hypothetical protein
VKARGPIAACLLVVLLAVGCSNKPTAVEAEASEAARARAELSKTPTTPPTVDPSATISVPPQPPVLAKNPLYRAGRLPAAGCAEPKDDITDLAEVRAFYTRQLRCLNKAWAPVIRKAGFAFKAPKLVVTTEPSPSSPCDVDDGRAYYCYDTIYMNAAEDLKAAKQDADGTKVWMAYDFGHEYGHHVQALAGILAASYQRGVTLNGIEAALEESRRVELQAFCLGAVAMGADRVAIPATEEWLEIFDWVVSHGEDPDRDHGSQQNEDHWATVGFDEASPAACNTFTAPSALVS